MANYVFIYSGGSMPATEAEAEAVTKAWADWYGKLGGALVDGGNPFSGQARGIASDGTVRASPVGVPATGYTIIKADSLDAAVGIAKGSPVLASGGQVSVYETYEVM